MSEVQEHYRLREFWVDSGESFTLRPGENIQHVIGVRRNSVDGYYVTALQVKRSKQPWSGDE